MYVCLISSLLCGMYKILRAILCDGKLISFQLYLSMKGLILDVFVYLLQYFYNLTQML